MTFSDLKLIQPLLSMLDKIGHSAPTPIQKQSIPSILEGKDIFGCAQTGTGKTAAFTLPILQLLQADKNNTSKKIRALILAPTRELAMQIGDNFKTYGENLSVTHTVVLGGVSQNQQISTLKKSVDVLIATPGRLLDLMNQGYICLDQVEYFVLDEADRMLDMGFIKDIQRIISKLPSKRQTLFFSATASPEIMKLAKTLLMNPVNVSVNPVSSTASLVEQSIYYVSKENKRSLLKYVLKNGKIDHALVFTRTKRGADKVARELNSNGIKAESIHGNKSQNARERALKGFKNRTIRILVATDIASRGIDVDKLTHVINYELPEQAETYVHRIGRTGRAGSSGTALSFCAQDELPYLNDIHKLIKKKIGTASVNPYA
ncbi:MAG TPA: DEAD/DEAH box helicase [Bacteroidia bacterium]|nr:DEAD/DEAH box helicase [Bacteroidia bacterium]